VVKNKADVLKAAKGLAFILLRWQKVLRAAMTMA
jgi:hypothetical protein